MIKIDCPPILFLIYNRPDTTKRVFESIKKAKPTKLYIASDGPRTNKENEEKRCDETKQIVENIDWECDVHRLYRTKNLGCGKAIREAITWFFSFETEGIILEDDCVPSQSFYPFCLKMLEMYNNDKKVMMISGNNPISTITNNSNDYHFLKWPHIWGWATWKDRWELYDNNLTDWPKFNINFAKDKYYNKAPIFREWASQTLDSVYLKGDKTTWSWKWAYTMLIRNGVTIVPNKNLIDNIGNEGEHGNGCISNLQNIGFDDMDIDTIKKESLIKCNQRLEIIRMNLYIKTTHPGIRKIVYPLYIIGIILRKCGLFPKHTNLHPITIFQKLINH